MATDPLDSLLVKLNDGGAATAEDVFLSYVPVLRVMVRRWLTPRLRAKFDSMDVVQSVWADLLKGQREGRWQFTDREHLKAFLAKVTYYHFINNCRRHRRSLLREEPLLVDEGRGRPVAVDPRPSQLAQANELWEQFLSLCPPAHRELLRLKRDGFALAEIAARTGLHESSVRRIIYDLSRRLAMAR